jgi:hypothetical protein
LDLDVDHGNTCQFHLVETGPEDALGIAIHVGENVLATQMRA